MTSDSRSGQRSADGVRRLRALRPSGLRMAAISSAFCLAAGAGISMAGQASAATARPAAAATVAGPASPAWGHKKKKRGIITKVFTSRFVKVRKFTKVTAFCPRGFVATGGGFLLRGGPNDVDVTASFPFPSFNGAIPFAWVVIAQRQFDTVDANSKMDMSKKRIFIKAFVVCTKKQKKKKEHEDWSSMGAAVPGAAARSEAGR